MSDWGRRPGKAWGLLLRSGLVRRMVEVWPAVPISMTLGAAPALAEPYGVAVLRVLDKVTARVSTVQAAIAEPIRFGALEIVVRTCDKRPPEEPPEAAAFVEIEELRPGQTPDTVFQGWMFASSRARSAMDHPVYDVWVLDCVNTSSTADPNRSGERSR